MKPASDSHVSSLGRRMSRTLGVLVLLTVTGSRNEAADGPRYNRDIRPILSDKCFPCHGPDAGKRKADLRLDLLDVAVQQGAVVPGKPAESALLARVSNTDPDEQMPPPTAKLGRLTDSEIDLLRRWIAAGAEYESHWSLIPLQPVAVPASEFASPIDALVRTRLRERGLKHQLAATRETLIRRLSFDLTGLPPTPAEVLAFLSDSDPRAYENLVDRLLSSPRYGERMAVDWLDVARYADSYGFQVDRERDVWMWRDWVIRAFNDNQRFDEFVTWQLAGDLLPNATDEQVLATAFNRLHQQEAEGGSVEEEYRVEYVCDRVQTFATTFLGLTFECARCHDHKFDPILQKEYYGLFAMFQNIDEAGLYSYFTTSPPTPTLLLTDAAANKQLSQLSREVAEAEEQLAAVRRAIKSPPTEWLKALRLKSPPRFELPGEVARFSFDALTDGKLANDVRADQPATLKGENRLVPGQRGNAVEFTGDDPVDLPLGNYQRDEPFTVSLWLQVPDVKDRAVVLHRSRAWTDAASRGYELLIDAGRLQWSLIHFWPGNAVSIRTRQLLPVQQWVQVTVSSDGSSRAAGLKLYLDGQPAEVDIVKDQLTKNITGGGGDNIALGERFRDRGLKGGRIDELRVWNRVLTELEALAVFDETAANAQLAAANDATAGAARQRLLEYYLTTADESWKKQLENVHQARRALNKFADAIPEIMVMRELPQPKPAYVLFRGEYNQRRDSVVAGTPGALSPFPADAPRNRLGLSRWLTAPNHPLTARVTVNRWWQGLFGRGLVKTAEDFGSQGARPLYPELLDWLATRLIDSGWNVKELLETIVMSETYRQASVADAASMSDDPDNEWLARGPRFRLPAEMIRDNALAAAGILREQLGGPPVNPYELAEAFKPFKVNTDSGVYRRSLYTNWRRTSPPPAMLTFDAPRRAVCSAKRERTDSPLQALILLNGTQYVEAARTLGERLHRDAAGDVARMIEAGFLSCLSRRPDEQEAAIARQLYREQREYYERHPAEADELLKIGAAARDTTIPAPAAAAAAVLGQALLNHDACVVKR